jgi:hypothetical protein
VTDPLDLLRQLADEHGIREELDRELTTDPTVVRHNCAFCGRERTRKDDNHGPDCAYWTFFPGGPA